MSNQSNQLIAIEALLEALNNADFYKDYVVRGSYISRQWMGDHSRICQDLDLLYLKDYQADIVVKHFTQLIHNTRDVSFDENTLVYEPIWEGTISPGVRFTVDYQLANQQSNLQIDIGCNDPLVIPPIEQTITSTNHAFNLRIVPLEILAAWKLHGLFEHLNGPWQSKTLWDLYLFCRFNTLDKNLFIKASEKAFSSRLDPIEIINRLLFGDFANSKKSKRYWAIDFPAFCSDDFIPLEDVLTWLKDYLNKVFAYPEHKESLLTQADIIRYRIKLLRENGSDQAIQKLKTLSQKRKILPYKAYNTIHHVPTSRLGPSEKCISEHQYHMLTKTMPDSNQYTIVVQEKLDGSCVCAYRKDGELFALGREGDLADHSPNESRRLWASWVEENKSRFMDILEDGERLCGEWLAMVHGTHYQLDHEPFVAFDLFTIKNDALTYKDFIARVAPSQFIIPHLIHYGTPCSLENALAKLGNGHHQSTDNPEGLMWRLERNNKIAFKAKYVRHDKIDGCYLTEHTQQKEQWNWHG